ncbi:CST complex subunit TEN1 [Carica papaya]|uniref:CST complex subunit TEN1 n=1 Tax=Carica papaya TaxID=3649 RepID=UPI000B8CB964|nr:CST complex subunit TEN1 [Carica papaya]XP_021898870.1 CST complex subunit TEN1 [Carica papaya]XP_021898871.1 CST complex subunit TEN1 [Carica papaya]
MESSEIKSGTLVTLQDLHPSSPFFQDGASFRVTGKLEEYSVETAIAVIADGDANLKIDTKNLRDLSFRIGSIYQFIGELHIQADNENEAILQARVGRNVDGIDLNLYYQTLQLLRQFQAECIKKQELDAVQAMNEDIAG